MKRTITALAAAAALVLTGCGSTAGTAAPATTTAAAVTSAASTTAAPPADTSASESSADGGTTGSSTADSSTEDSSTPEDTTSADTSASDTFTEGTTTGDTTESTSDGPETTINATDGDTLAWFGEFCGAVVPLAKAPKDTSATYKADAVSYLKSFGGGLLTAAQKLSTISPPGFDGGAQFSAKVVTAFAAVAPKITQLGTDLEASAATDKATVTKAVKGASEAFDDIGNTLGLDKINFDDETEAAIGKVPACGPLFGS